MNDLLNHPEGFFDNIRRYTASVATTLVYGQRGATFDSFWAHVSRLPRVRKDKGLMEIQGVYDVMTKAWLLKSLMVLDAKVC